MMIEPIDKCITKLKEERNYDEIIYMTPDGEQLNQQIANECSLKKNIIILCGHYKGVDQRVRDHFITRDNLLAPPIYTRPANYNGWEVPPILTSGNTPAVDLWREEQAFERTERLRPDLLKD